MLTSTDSSSSLQRFIVLLFSQPPVSLTINPVIVFFHTMTAPQDLNAQAVHRTHLTTLWDIAENERVLEIGCGQGDCTTVLATKVGPSGHIDAVDPGALDYGSPWTLGQAQKYISESSLGSRITWHQADPVSFLGHSNLRWDVAVLSHCIWYFATSDVLKQILGRLADKVKRVCIAEYALQASSQNAVPHLLAALTRGVYHSQNPNNDANIRTVLDCSRIAQIANEVGWFVEKEVVITPDPALEDGRWEAQMLVSEKFRVQVAGLEDVAARTALNSMMAAVASARKDFPGRLTWTMDVWCVTFTRRI